MSRIRSTISTPYAAVNRHHKLTPGQLLTILFDGPGPATCRIEGKKRRFFGYEARGAPDGPDDGSLAPWAVAASLPFAPEIVAPALRYFETLKLRQSNPYGFKATFNATIGERSHPPQLWVSQFHFGINQGPIVLMIENFRTDLIWNLMRRCPYLAVGLDRAGFTGGWLGAQKTLRPD